MIRWKLRRKRHTTPGQQAASHALQQAENHVRDAEERQPEVTLAAARLRTIRERNHFAELFRAAIEGGA
ncbi:hypothetical protein ACIREK_30690 [Streptomyces sp. NPDC102415]|uniref:DUF7620 family protein n=1 Tax=Streptomyces sp. NPDC102415 TaxID=3366173 RepID=UPI00380DE107